MKPTREGQATLVDLLDRVLDKGLVLDADVVICVAGIPLLGVKLRAALAGMETMLKYGIWTEWDAAQRAEAFPLRGNYCSPGAPSPLTEDSSPGAGVPQPVN